jgi:serine protease Do
LPGRLVPALLLVSLPLLSPAPLLADRTPPREPGEAAATAGPDRPVGRERDEYADSFLHLKPQVRDYERDPANRYTYCIRSVAVYECLSYGSDGAIRRQRTRAISHGTGFAYREQGGETYLLTNQHVADWPQVTDTHHKVEDVPAGCKRVSDTLKIVDNEDDDYGGDDVPLTRVVADEALDAAVVKARAKLRLLPYRLGRAAQLQTGDVVLIRGFPLGAFQAVNTGKVVNPYDKDHYKEWDHVDFIIDAPLSTGNSGSPVLAVSKRTGEYELVGMYHAGYVRATALNAVVGIEQLRDLMFTLKRSARGREAAEKNPGPDQRAELELALQQSTFLPYLALGPLQVAVRRAGPALLFEVFSRRFPLDDRRLLVLLDQPVAGGFGTLSRVWFGNERGLKAYETQDLDGEVLAQVQAAQRRLHALAIATLRFRALSERAAASREAVAERSALQRAINREAGGDPDLAQVLVELAERLAPRPADPALTFGTLLAELVRPATSETAPAAPLASPVAKTDQGSPSLWEGAGGRKSIEQAAAARPAAPAPPRKPRKARQ